MFVPRQIESCPGARHRALCVVLGIGVSRCELETLWTQTVGSVVVFCFLTPWTEHGEDALVIDGTLLPALEVDVVAAVDRIEECPGEGGGRGWVRVGADQSDD